MWSSNLVITYSKHLYLYLQTGCVCYWMRAATSKPFLVPSSGRGFSVFEYLILTILQALFNFYFPSEPTYWERSRTASPYP